MSVSTRTVKALVEKKPVPAVKATQSVEDAIKAMDNCSSHAVGIMIDGYFAGLFTRGDLIRKVIKEGKNPRKTLLAEVMTVSPRTITRDCDFREAFFYLCKYNYSSLPVVEKGRFYGIISEDDLRQEIAANLKQVTMENNMLLSYIKGESYGMCAG